MVNVPRELGPELTVVWMALARGGGAPEMVVRMALARIAQDAAEAAPLDQVQHDNPLFLLYI